VKRLILIFTLFFSGCSFKKLKPITLYNLGSPKVTTSFSKYANKTLKVSYPISTKETLGYKIKYVNNNQIGYYLNSQWSQDLGTLLQGFVLEALNNTKAFKAALPYNSIVLEDYRLELIVEKFYNLVQNGNSYAVVEIRVNLISLDNNRVLKSKLFSYKVKANKVNAKGYIFALKKALNSFANDLVRWI
jgi:ABC-type uncharacterized transport system auxiliary subunit